MKKMTPNPETGFLENPRYHENFDSRRKVLFLKFLEKNPFRIFDACEAVGIQDTTYYKHLAMDSVFAGCVRKIKDTMIQRVEQTLAECASNPTKTIDRIFFLKAHKPHLYNPVQKFESTQQVVFDITGAKDAMKFNSVVEGQVVSDSSNQLQVATESGHSSTTDASTERKSLPEPIPPAGEVSTNAPLQQAAP